MRLGKRQFGATDECKEYDAKIKDLWEQLRPFLNDIENLKNELYQDKCDAWYQSLRDSGLTEKKFRRLDVINKLGEIYDPNEDTCFIFPDGRMARASKLYAESFSTLNGVKYGVFCCMEDVLREHYIYGFTPCVEEGVYVGQELFFKEGNILWLKNIRLLALHKDTRLTNKQKQQIKNICDYIKKNSRASKKPVLTINIWANHRPETQFIGPWGCYEYTKAELDYNKVIADIEAAYKTPKKKMWNAE